MPPDVTIEILLRDRFSRHFAHQFNLGSLTPSRSLLIMHAVLFCGLKHSLVVRATSAPIFGQRVFAYFLTGLVPQESTALRLTCFQALKYIYIYISSCNHTGQRGGKKSGTGFKGLLSPQGVNKQFCICSPGFCFFDSAGCRICPLLLELSQLLQVFLSCFPLTN